jgi:hypothetical protein
MGCGRTKSGTRLKDVGLLDRGPFVGVVIFDLFYLLANLASHGNI